MTKVLLAWPGHSSSTYSVSKYYSKAFKELGVRVEDFLYHNEVVLQNAAINRVRGTEGEDYSGEAMYLATQMLMGKIAAVLPDYVVAVTGLALWKNVWQQLLDLRRELKHPYKIVLVLTESPYRPGEELELSNFADYVFTNEREFVSRLRQFQPRSYYLPQAYDPDVHKLGDEYSNHHKVYMCGSGYRERVKVLEGVDWSIARLTLKGIWRDLEGTALEQYYEEGIVPNKEVVEDYHNSAICLNIHRQKVEHILFEVDRPGYHKDKRGAFALDSAYSMNNRAVEIAASHGFQLCDDSRAEVAEVFGDAVPTYSVDDSGELENLIEYYIPRPGLRRKLASGAAERIEGRTYRENAKKVLSKLEE